MAETKKKTQNAPETTAEAEQQESGFILDRALKVTKPLMKGNDVKAVQAALAKKKFLCGTDVVNGIYGASTALAVRHFQSMNRLIVNGQVGEHTAKALGGSWLKK